MKKIIIITVILFFANAAMSQEMNTGSDYTTAVGIKVFPGSISVKHFIKDHTAIEGLGYFWQYGFRGTALYQLYGDFSGVEGLKWYIGAGAHTGFYNAQWAKDYPTRPSGIEIGADGVLGVDYKISGAPIDVSFDWQPSINLVGYNNFQGGWGGLGVRYAF